MNEKIFIMLIGVPSSGKSYFVKNTLPQLLPNKKFIIISSDKILDRKAAEQGKTYSEIFNNEIKSATSEMSQEFRNAIANNENVIWDQTNLTPNTRKGKLLQVPKDYFKIAIVLKVPEPEELQRRLNSRPGKFIPLGVVNSMIDQFTPPTYDEGFDKIINL